LSEKSSPNGNPIASGELPLAAGQISVVCLLGISIILFVFWAGKHFWLAYSPSQSARFILGADYA